jgi:imidazole glycerol phosphate synthase glutamine amidotransferase subunit
MKVSIIDYGAGNLPSVERAFRSLGVEGERITCSAQLAAARAIVLPGVGHFSAFVGAALEANGLATPLRAAFNSGIPILGICLGLQAMFAGSEEAPEKRGLGFLAGEVRALPATAKSPHIGWNQVRRFRPSQLLRGVPEEAHFYFAHSYGAPGAGDHVAAVCDHGCAFAAVIEHRNLFAVQFHPEKSGEIGARVLRNFLEAIR